MVKKVLTTPDCFATASYHLCERSEVQSQVGSVLLLSGEGEEQGACALVGNGYAGAL